MDEMEEYRSGIERRYGDRRQLKNDRRHNHAQAPEPKFFDPVFVIDMLIFAALGIALYFVS